MRIAIGSEHAGFKLKEAVKAFLIEEKRQTGTSGQVGSPSGPPFTHASETPLASSLAREITAR
jgi:ribose 5-phosphate isomerase RpiB